MSYPDLTSALVEGSITVPPSRSTVQRIAYTTYGSGQMHVHIDDFNDATDGDFPMVQNVAFAGGAVSGRVRGVTQSIPALADVSAAGWDGYSFYNWRNVAGTMVASTPGAYRKVEFTGTSLSIDVDATELFAAGAAAADFPWIAVSIDGGAYTLIQVPSSSPGTPIKTIALASGLAGGTHRATVVSAMWGTADRWTTPVAPLRIAQWTVDVAATLSGPTTRAPRTMMFYGDSITEGWNAETVGHDPVNRAELAWCVQTADDFSAEFAQLGFSGVGYTIPAFNVPAFPSSLDLHSAGQSRLSVGVLSPAPDIIVVFHGANDGAASDASVSAAVKTSMESLRAIAPLAQIVVVADVLAVKVPAILTGFTDYQTAHPADALVYYADPGASGQAIIADPSMTTDGAHPNAAGHTALASLMTSIIADALGMTTTVPYQVKAENSTDGTFPQYFDVASDGSFAFFHADTDPSHWNFTPIRTADSLLFLPAWPDETTQLSWKLSTKYGIHEERAPLDAGAYPFDSPATGFFSPVFLAAHVDTDGTMTAEVDPDPATGPSELRVYTAWNLLTNTAASPPTYAAVPDRRVVNAGAQIDGLRLDVVTMLDLLQWHDTLPLDPSGRFSIAITPGSRVELQLVDTTTFAILSRASMTNQLPREFFFYTGDTDLLENGDPALGSGFEEVAFAYGVACCALAFLTAHDWENARRVLYGLARMQQADNGVAFAWSQRFEDYATNSSTHTYRSGNISWFVVALEAGLALIPSSYWAGDYAAWQTAIETASDNAASWLRGQMTSLGLVRFGTGKQIDAVTFDETYQFPTDPADPAYSTEHNHRAWLAFMKRYARTGDAADLTTARTIRDAIMAYLWRADVKRFWQGCRADGTPDGAGALDNHSLGIQFLVSIGRAAEATTSLDWIATQYGVTSVADDGAASPGASIRGYTPYVAADNQPNATPSVWIEGTSEVIGALRRLGRTVGNLHANIAALQQEIDGSFRNFQLSDAVYEYKNYRSLTAAAMYVIATDPTAAVWTESDT